MLRVLRTVCVATTVLVGVLHVVSETSAAPPRFEVGQPFPDITLPALDDGRPLTVSHFRGKKLVLQIFASW